MKSKHDISFVGIPFETETEMTQFFDEKLLKYRNKAMLKYADWFHLYSIRLYYNPYLEMERNGQKMWLYVAYDNKKDADGKFPALEFRFKTEDGATQLFDYRKCVEGFWAMPDGDTAG